MEQNIWWCGTLRFFSNFCVASQVVSARKCNPYSVWWKRFAQWVCTMSLQTLEPSHPGKVGRLQKHNSDQRDIFPAVLLDARWMALQWVSTAGIAYSIACSCVGLVQGCSNTTVQLGFQCIIGGCYMKYESTRPFLVLLHQTPLIITITELSATYINMFRSSSQANTTRTKQP